MGRSTSWHIRGWANLTLTACSLVSIFFRAQRLQRPMQQFPPQFFFLLGRNIRVSDDVDDAVT